MAGHAITAIPAPVIADTEHEAPDGFELIPHIGREGDRRALCGAPTLGVKAPNGEPCCEDCTELWANMHGLRKWVFRHRPWRHA